MSLLLRVAALVLFVLAALFFFGVGSVHVDTIFGLQAAGLGCWVASTFPFPAMQA